ncbi:MAG: hypothetical protein E7208_11580 [Clostridium butyricum]|nr:hypothetical protein [Clostridium butyricum]
MNDINLENLNGEEIWEKLYNKELDCKKNILEYIEMTRILIKKQVEIYQIESTYNFIYRNIDKMSDKVKPNTIMFLQNKLKAQLGKYVSVKDPKMQSTFLEFFKEAYPKGERRKDFTWVLIDINNISEEQIWNTLIYINRQCLSEELILEDEEIEDIIKMIEKLVKKNNKKYINDVRSLDTLNHILNIKIVQENERFIVKRIRE